MARRKETRATGTTSRWIPVLGMVLLLVWTLPGVTGESGVDGELGSAALPQDLGVEKPASNGTVNIQDPPVQTAPSPDPPAAIPVNGAVVISTKPETEPTKESPEVGLGNPPEEEEDGGVAVAAPGKEAPSVPVINDTVKVTEAMPEEGEVTTAGKDPVVELPTMPPTPPPTVAPTTPPTEPTTTTPTTTTTSPTTTTTEVTTTTTTTTTVPPPVVSIVPSEPPKGPATTDPPYVHVTVPTSSPGTTQNATIAGIPAASTAFSPKVIIIIVAAAVGLIVIIIIITVVVLLIRRKRRRDRNDIPIVENPRYTSASSQQGHNYRFSRDASLMIGGPHLANNNYNEKSDMNSLRKKRRAPPAPNPFTGEVDAFALNTDAVEYYEKLYPKQFPTSKRKAPPPPVPSFTGGIGGLSNPYSIEYFEQLSRNKTRRAPPPPNPFTGEVDAFINPNSVEYIEQDTPHGSEVELTTFGIKAAQPEVPSASVSPSQGVNTGTGTNDDAVEQNDYFDSDEDDATRSAEELEGRALLDDIERETGYRIGHTPSGGERKSVADKYQFSDDEEARDSRDYRRSRELESLGDSEDDLEEQGAMSYDVSDIADITDKLSSSDTPSSERSLPSAPGKNPFES